MNQFIHDIPSIHQRHPGLPAALGNIDLNRGIQAGDPLNYAEVRNARATVAALKALRDPDLRNHNPNVTDQLVTAAQSRAVTVETMYASLEYTPQNLVQALQHITHRLDDLHGDMLTGLAYGYNTRIISRNTRRQSPLPLIPLQKSNPGYGRDTALPLIGVLSPANRQTFHNNYPENGNAHPIGSVPNPFNATLEFYTHADILQMVVFYNDNFGIDPGDGLPERLIKFRQFLTEF